MNCPDCDTKLERDDGLKGGKIPYAIYSCEECGSEFRWELGVRGLERVNQENISVDGAFRNRRIVSGLFKSDEDEYGDDDLDDDECYRP